MQPYPFTLQALRPERLQTACTDFITRVLKVDVYIYIYIYICICLCVHAYMYICIHTHTTYPTTLPCRRCGLSGRKRPAQTSSPAC